MPEEQIQIHHVLGISDERSKEIEKEIPETLIKAGIVDVGVKKLMERYDGEALLAGMRLMQAIQMNNRVDQYNRNIRGFRAAFGDKQNAESN